MSGLILPPLIPAQAGTQAFFNRSPSLRLRRLTQTVRVAGPSAKQKHLGPRFRGDERLFGLGVAFLTLLASPAVAQTGDVAKGETAFENRCTMCHGPESDGQGPKLAGVVGRKAGSAPGFPYSDALKTSRLTWTPAELDTFLAGPDKLVPGTAMAVTISDPDQRRDIVAYLASLKP